MTESEILNATRDELMAKCEELGLEINKRDKKEEFQKQIADALGIVLNDGESKELATPTPARKVAGKLELNGRKIWIRIQSDSKDKQPIPVSLNGNIITIKRGHWVHIPIEYAMILDQAERYEVDRESGDLRSYKSYPFESRETKPEERAVRVGL